MGRTKFEAGGNLNMAALMIWLNRSRWSTVTAVIMGTSFFSYRGILKNSKKGVYGSASITIESIGLGGFMDTELTNISVQR